MLITEYLYSSTPYIRKEDVVEEVQYCMNTVPTDMPEFPRFSSNVLRKSSPAHFVVIKISQFRNKTYSNVHQDEYASHTLTTAFRHQHCEPIDQELSAHQRQLC